jgi:hypothetical protein
MAIFDPALFSVPSSAVSGESRGLDPLIRVLDEAPLDDEEISPEEESAVQEAGEELAAGAPTIPLRRSNASSI